MMKTKMFSIARIYVLAKRRTTLDGRRRKLHRLEACRSLGEESILGYLVEARQHRLFRSELPICSKSRHHVHRRCAVLGRSAEEPNCDCGEYELQSVLCSLRYALPTAATFS
jgi:hypothetical protein